MTVERANHLAQFLYDYPGHPVVNEAGAQMLKEMSALLGMGSGELPEGTVVHKTGIAPSIMMIDGQRNWTYDPGEGAA